MPHELDRIKELAGLQQEAPAAGDQALAKDLANHFMNKANEFKKSGDTGPEYEEMVDIAKAFQQGQDQGMEEINDLANFEFSAHPFGGKFSNNEGEPEDEVLAILNKHGYSFTEKSHPERPNRGLVTLIKKDAKESAVQEAEPQDTADDLISTITKLAQDAVEKSNFSDLRLFKAKEREIQELIKKEPNNDALRQIWNYYPSKNTPPKKGRRFGDIDVSQAELQAQHEAMIERLLREIINIGRKHLNLPRYLANFDKSDLTAPQQQGLAALVKKYANRKTYGGGGLIDGYLDYLAQTGVWTDAADEKEFDMALKKLGHKNLAAWEKRAQGEELEQFLGLAPITAQAQNDVEKVLGKGFQNNEELISAASDYVRSLPESASQVDDTIQRARAQIETLEAALKEDYKKFQGMKPYKPKKK